MQKRNDKTPLSRPNRALHKTANLNLAPRERRAISLALALLALGMLVRLLRGQGFFSNTKSRR